MGVVEMKSEMEFLSRGYPYHKATLYVYCDRCGSFNLKTYISLRKWVLIASSFGLVGAVVFEYNRSGVVYLSWPLFGLVMIILAFALFWRGADYRCRRCGSVTTTKYNTLDYPSDMGIVDVPDHIVQKRYLGYWPDMCDLDEELDPKSAPTVEEKLRRLGKGVLIVTLAVPASILWFCYTMVLVLVGGVISSLFPSDSSSTKKRH
jgi:hypothetical protein